MAKPDPALLNPARYAHAISIATRYADLDPNQHINNIAISAMFEDARLRFMLEAGRGWPNGATGMVASLNIEYLNQSHYPEPLDFHCAVTRIGRSSVETLQLAMQNGLPVALGTTVFVATDAGRPSPLPPEWRARLSALELKP